jgi:hypothetical protein
MDLQEFKTKKLAYGEWKKIGLMQKLIINKL